VIKKKSNAFSYDYSHFIIYFIFTISCKIHETHVYSHRYITCN